MPNNGNCDNEHWTDSKTARPTSGLRGPELQDVCTGFVSYPRVCCGSCPVAPQKVEKLVRILRRSENQCCDDVLPVCPSAFPFGSVDQQIQATAERRRNAHTDWAFGRISKQPLGVYIFLVSHPDVLVDSKLLYIYVYRKASDVSI